MMKKIILCSIFVALLLSGCAESEKMETPFPSQKVVEEANDEKIIIEEPVPLTQEEELELLSRKTTNEELAENEEKYINYFYIGNPNCVAVLDLHGIGMHQMFAKIYASTNYGKKWYYVTEAIMGSGTVEYLTNDEGLVFNVSSIVTGENIKTVISKKELWGE